MQGRYGGHGTGTGMWEQGSEASGMRGEITRLHPIETG